MLPLVAYALICFLSRTTAQYVIEDDYNPSSFADMFDFYTGADPTAGYVTYVDQNTAETGGLYSTQNGSVYMGVDSTNVATGSGRNSVRVTSKKSYNHGLIILDLEHMPGGICGTWPAFWMLDSTDWPINGELDIIEGVNSASTNTMTLHTDPGCSISNTGAFSGTMETSNCDVSAADQAANQGCGIYSSNEATFGSGFNALGGGVYATEWTGQSINIWFFPRSAIPSDITNGNPDPSGWGLALSSFSGDCNIDEHISDMQIVFDTTFCGEWAGSVWSTDATCSRLAPTCQDFVQNNPSQFAEAYWLVNSLKVYQSSGAVPTSTPVPPSTPMPIYTPVQTTSTNFTSTPSLTTSYSISLSTPSTPYMTDGSASSVTPVSTLPTSSISYPASTWSSWTNQYTSAWPSVASQPWTTSYVPWQGESATGPIQTQSWGSPDGGPNSWGGFPPHNKR